MGGVCSVTQSSHWSMSALVVFVLLLGAAVRGDNTYYATATGGTGQNCFTPATACGLSVAIGLSNSDGSDIALLPGVYTFSSAFPSVGRGFRVSRYNAGGTLFAQQAVLDLSGLPTSLFSVFCTTPASFAA